jgi:hypothetical protein
MADIVSEQQPTPLSRPAPAPTPAAHRRFGFAYLLLAAVVGAAVGLVVVFATRDHHRAAAPDGPAWASWRPQTGGTLGVREIARHVGPQYHLANGHQLVSIVAGPMIYPTVGGAVPVSAILVSSGQAGVRQERVGVTFPQAGVFYQTCGSQAACQIEGTATTERGVLLLREVLELALYTFHDIPEADNVVVFLPPAPGVPQNDPRYRRAIYLPREALSAQLSAPLAATLPGRASGFTPETFTQAERNRVLGILAGHLFHFDFQQGADSSALLQLSPIDF